MHIPDFTRISDSWKPHRIKHYRAAECMQRDYNSDVSNPLAWSRVITNRTSPACKREVISRNSIPSWSPILGWRRGAVPIG